MDRICAREGCDQPLPPGSAPQRKFHTKRCQVAEWRRRAAERAQADDKPPA